MTNRSIADPASSYTAATNTIDAFIRILRQHRSPSHLLAYLEHLIGLQSALNDAAHSLAIGQLPPEPLRSNYRARLQTLSFELHRVQPLLQQEHSRLTTQLHGSTTRRSWLETLSTTQ